MRFTKDHQWVEMSGGMATIGVSAWQGEHMDDAVGVTLLFGKGDSMAAGQPWAEVDTAGKTLKLLAPIDGEVVEVNDRLNDEPELLDTSPETLAWFARLKPADPEQVEALMDRDAYEAYLDSL